MLCCTSADMLTGLCGADIDDISVRKNTVVWCVSALQRVLRSLAAALDAPPGGVYEGADACRGGDGGRDGGGDGGGGGGVGVHVGAVRGRRRGAADVGADGRRAGLGG